MTAQLISRDQLANLYASLANNSQPKPDTSDPRVSQATPNCIIIIKCEPMTNTVALHWDLV